MSDPDTWVTERTLYGAFAVKGSVSSFWFLQRLVAGADCSRSRRAHCGLAARLGRDRLRARRCALACREDDEFEAELACGARRNVPQPCIRWGEDPEP